MTEALDLRGPCTWSGQGALWAKFSTVYLSYSPVKADCFMLQRCGAEVFFLPVFFLCVGVVTCQTPQFREQLCLRWGKCTCLLSPTENRFQCCFTVKPHKTIKTSYGVFYQVWWVMLSILSKACKELTAFLL